MNELPSSPDRLAEIERIDESVQIAFGRIIIKFEQIGFIETFGPVYMGLDNYRFKTPFQNPDNPEYWESGRPYPSQNLPWPLNGDNSQLYIGQRQTRLSGIGFYWKEGEFEYNLKMVPEKPGSRKPELIFTKHKISSEGNYEPTSEFKYYNGNIQKKGVRGQIATEQSTQGSEAWSYMKRIVDSIEQAPILK